MNVLASAASAAFLILAPIAASAVTLTPAQVSATNGVADGVATIGVRSDLDNAFDGDSATFFSLGAGGELTVDVSPLVLVSPASVIEVTFGAPNPNFPESAQIFFDATLAGEIFNDGMSNAEAGFSFTPTNSSTGSAFQIDFASGVFSTLRVVDTTLVNFAGSYGGRGQPARSDGFDVAEVAVEVAPVPLPPALALMLAPLFALGVIGRRRRAAA